MVQTEVAARLWEQLEGLSRGLDPTQPSIPTVRVTLDSGSVLEVFRAEPVESTIAAWRVRGFAGPTPVRPSFETAIESSRAWSTSKPVRLAVILGTRDGRAMVTERVSDATEEALVGGLVVNAEPGTRALIDLSEAIAAAVRALMEPAS